MEQCSCAAPLDASSSWLNAPNVSADINIKAGDLWCQTVKMKLKKGVARQLESCASQTSMGNVMLAISI
jgi:hypothetical protein